MPATTDVPGKLMALPNTLSRSPSKQTYIDKQTVEEVALFVNSIVDSKLVPDRKLDQIRQETELDRELQVVMDLTRRG